MPLTTKRDILLDEATFVALSVLGVICFPIVRSGILRVFKDDSGKIMARYSNEELAEVDKKIKGISLCNNKITITDLFVIVY